jgi:hypothetical protein
METAFTYAGVESALSTDHAASSYGMPVLIVQGQAYGKADCMPNLDESDPLQWMGLAASGAQWVLLAIHEGMLDPDDPLVIRFMGYRPKGPNEESCSKCEGSGHLLHDPEYATSVQWDECPICKGVGFISKDEQKRVKLRINITPSEKADLEQRAEENGQTVSRYIRDRIF